MNLQSLLKKYSLPRNVKVIIEKSDKGFVVQFPELKGCVTFVKDPLELNYKITDALLTYFEVPRHVAEGQNILYVPTTKLSSPKKSSVETNFSFFAALNSFNGYNPRIR